MTNRAKIKRASHSSGIRWFSGSALFRAGLFGLRCWTTFVKLQDFNLREAASAVHLAVLRASRRSGGLPALRTMVGNTYTGPNGVCRRVSNPVSNPLDAPPDLQQKTPRRTVARSVAAWSAAFALRHTPLLGTRYDHVNLH